MSKFDTTHKQSDLHRQHDLFYSNEKKNVDFLSVCQDRLYSKIWLEVWPCGAYYTITFLKDVMLNDVNLYIKRGSIDSVYYCFKVKTGRFKIWKWLQVQMVKKCSFKN